MKQVYRRGCFPARSDLEGGAPRGTSPPQGTEFVPLPQHQQPPSPCQRHPTARLEQLGQTLGQPDDRLGGVQCGDELGVVVLEVADDLAVREDGVALGTDLILETETAVEAGAGEDGGDEERSLALAEDGGGWVAGGQALAAAEERP